MPRLFGTDGVRGTANRDLTPEERGALHHRTAQLLLERTPAERLPVVSFQLADHLCGALDRLDEPERVRAIEILGLAGRVALEKGAPATAAYYLGFARSDVERLLLEQHHARTRNSGAAGWRLLVGRLVLVYDHPDGDDPSAARLVTLWRRR